MSLTRTKLVSLVGGWAVVCLALAVNVQAQQGQQPGPGGPRGFGFGFGGGGPLAMLQRTDVQEELVLVDEQKAQLRALGEKARDRMGELFRGGRGGDGGNAGADRRDELRETFRKFNEEMQAEVDKILLPHQSKRLKQLEVQMRMRGGVMGALGGDVAEQLGISEDQRDKLREKANGLEQELRKKTVELRKQMQEQLLAELSPEQRKQFSELVGEPFEFRDEGPPGGGPGGPGGFRGRGGEGGQGAGDRRRRPDGQE